MAKGTQVQSRQSNAIHLVQWDGTPAILNRGRERASLSLVDPATVLKELVELLEDYAPVWYTEENHQRAVAALAHTMR